jgi:hypothetical protein
MIPRIALVAVAALIVSNVLWAFYAMALVAQRDRARLERAEMVATALDVEARARSRVLEIERAQGEAMADIAAKHFQEMTNAESAHAVVVRDLRAGALSLRRHWQGCQATNDLSRAAEAASRVDDAAKLRAKGAGDLVRVGAECDASIRAWQRYAGAVRGDR